MDGLCILKLISLSFSLLSSIRLTESFFFLPPVHQRLLQWDADRKLRLDSRWAAPHRLVLPHRVHLCYWWDDRGPDGGQTRYQIWKVCVWTYWVYNTCSVPPACASDGYKHLWESWVKRDPCVSEQERDAGQSHCAGVYRSGSHGLQQMVQDARDGHFWTLHHRNTLR